MIGDPVSRSCVQLKKRIIIVIPAEVLPCIVGWQVVVDPLAPVEAFGGFWAFAANKLLRLLFADSAKCIISLGMLFTIS